MCFCCCLFAYGSVYTSACWRMVGCGPGPHRPQRILVGDLDAHTRTHTRGGRPIDRRYNKGPYVGRYYYRNHKTIGSISNQTKPNPTNQPASAFEMLGSTSRTHARTRALALTAFWTAHVCVWMCTRIAVFTSGRPRV